jgi:hypothetical protein
VVLSDANDRSNDSRTRGPELREHAVQSTRIVMLHADDTVASHVLNAEGSYALHLRVAAQWVHQGLNINTSRFTAKL